MSDRHSTLILDIRRCHKCSTDKLASAFHNKGTHTECKECVRRRNAAYRLNMGDELKAKKKAYAERHKASISEKARLYREQNKEKLRKKDALKYQKNRAVRSAKAREWRQANPHVVNALAQKAKAARLRAVPPWADLEAIKEVYKEAQRITKETGIEHHVDHIVPLQSPLVCGLHCEANLRVIPGFVNQSKHNRLLPEVAEATL